MTRTEFEDSTIITNMVTPRRLLKELVPRLAIGYLLLYTFLSGFDAVLYDDSLTGLLAMSISFYLTISLNSLEVVYNADTKRT